MGHTQNRENNVLFIGFVILMMRMAFVLRPGSVNGG